VTTPEELSSGVPGLDVLAPVVRRQALSVRTVTANDFVTKKTLRFITRERSDTE
jgi:hypothetical protein